MSANLLPTSTAAEMQLHKLTARGESGEHTNTQKQTEQKVLQQNKKTRDNLI